MEQNEQLNFINLKFDNSDPPKFVEKKDIDWVIFGTEQPYYNRYPDFIEDLFDRANKHSAMINKKVFFICGNGVSINTAGLQTWKSSELLDLLKRSNEYGEDIGCLVKKVTFDYEKHNGAYLEINWSRNEKKFNISHIPFKCLRIAKDKKSYYYSKNWALPKQKQVPGNEETEFREIPIFNPEKRDGKQIYALKGYHSAIDYYPKPNYLAAVPSAETEYEIANYHLKSIKSGFHIGTIISFIGNPTDKEKDAIEEQLKAKFQGTDKAGSLLLMFSRDKDNRPEVVRISPDELDKKFETLSKSVNQELTIAHHITPMLAGVEKDTPTWGRTELLVMYEYFKATYVNDRRKDIEKYFNDLYSVLGFQNRIIINETRPLSPFDYKDIINDMTREERRELAGLPRQTPTVKTGFSSELTVLQQVGIALTYAGEPMDNFKIESKTKVDKDGFHLFAKDPTGLEKNILELIRKDELISPETLAEILKTDIKKIEKTIDNLKEDGLLKEGTKKSGGEKVETLKPTADGIDYADGAKAEKYEIRYSYGLAPDASHPNKPILDTSHEFCKVVYGAKKLYTRNEIEAMSSKFGYNVWEMRGGWQTIKDTDIHVPYCRHIWVANKVKRK